jgi:hypothetical protein
MQKLESYDFTRPSRSRYKEAVKALIDEGVYAVRLAPGEDFPSDVKIDGVVSAVANEVKKRGRHARTFRERDEDTDAFVALVVSLWPEGEEPRQSRRGRRRVSAPA